MQWPPTPGTGFKSCNRGCRLAIPIASQMTTTIYSATNANSLARATETSRKALFIGLTKSAIVGDDWPLKYYARIALSSILCFCCFCVSLCAERVDWLAGAN